MWKKVYPDWWLFCLHSFRWQCHPGRLPNPIPHPFPFPFPIAQSPPICSFYDSSSHKDSWSGGRLPSLVRTSELKHPTPSDEHGGRWMRKLAKFPILWLVVDLPYKPYAMHNLFCQLWLEIVLTGFITDPQLSLRWRISLCSSPQPGICLLLDIARASCCKLQLHPRQFQRSVPTLRNAYCLGCNEKS